MLGLEFGSLARRSAEPRNMRNTRKSDPVACFLSAYFASSEVTLPRVPAAAGRDPPAITGARRPHSADGIAIADGVFWQQCPRSSAG